eukprot:3912610-Pleurochrysis_carterae.AAC.2
MHAACAPKISAQLADARAAATPRNREASEDGCEVRRSNPSLLRATAAVVLQVIMVVHWGGTPVDLEARRFLFLALCTRRQGGCA